MSKIPADTHKKLIHCTCGAIAIDGCEYYVRVIGERVNWDDSLIEKRDKGKKTRYVAKVG